MNNKYVLVLLCVVLISSCKFVRPFFIKNEKKEARKEKREIKKEEKNATVKIDSFTVVKKDTLFIPASDTLLARDIIKSNNIDYNTIQFSTKIHYESGSDKQNFSASFRLLHKKIIWVSIHVPIIGEVARAIITPDSVKAIEKINKKAYLYSYKDIQKLINIDIDFISLQQIIVGNAIAINGKITSIKEVGNVYAIFINGKDFTNQLNYSKLDTTLTQFQLQTTRPISNSSILVAQSKFQKTDGKYISMQRDFHIQDVKGAAYLSMDINKVEMNKDIDFPFKLITSYKLQNN